MESERTQPSESEDRGVLVGTESEQAPGVGGTGDHPAPAAMRDPETGAIHVAGEPPNGIIAGTQAPEGDDVDLSQGFDERGQEPSEPEQIDIERPDIGTE